MVALQAINRWEIGKHVPLEGSISYKELAEHVKFPELKLRRMLRYTMTQRIFQEPELNQIAHTETSSMIAHDPGMKAWLSIITDLFWPIALNSINAFEKWPSSNSPKETAPAAWKGSETTWFEEVAASKGGMADFRKSMGFIGSGEGWETYHLAQAYPWGSFGSGTVVDVSVSLFCERILSKLASSLKEILLV